MGNDNKKTFRFNIVDAILVVAVLAIAGALVFRSADAERLSLIRTKTNIEYVLKINSVQEHSGDMVKPDDFLYDKKTNKSCGKIISVTPSQAELYVTLMTGEIVKRYTPKRIDITLVVEAEGFSDQSGYYLDGHTFIAPNKELHVYTPNIDFIGTVKRVASK